MSFKLNILANYISQLYVTLIGILILPLYIEYIGAEAYGLIGFFALLQSWFALLDLGLTPTISRETARYFSGSTDLLSYSKLFKLLNLIFILIAFLGGAFLWLAADFISSKWLTIDKLDIDMVVFSIQVMAISIALRWYSGLYRGVITGAEKQVLLGGFNSLVATLRFIVVFYSMYIFGYTIEVFFAHQLLVAIFEFLGLFIIGKRLLPQIDWKRVEFSFEPIKPLLKFSMIIAFTSSVWVMVTQTDKLVLSGLLPIEEYGYFTLAVLAASGITILSGPVGNAIMPRMASLHSIGSYEALLNVYRNSTQLVSIVVGGATITIVFCSESLLYAWTGDIEIVSHAAPIMKLYAIGNGFLALAAFPYYLQFARGNLRYHLIGNVVLAAILIPSIILSAVYYGAIGAGVVWISLNACFLFFWVGFVHFKLEPGLHLKWIFSDFIFICLPSIVVLVVFFDDRSITDSRLYEFGYVVFVGGVVLITSCFSSPLFRVFMKERFLGFMNA